MRPDGMTKAKTSAGSQVRCRFGCGWWEFAGRPVMKTVGALHARTAHEAKCPGRFSALTMSDTEQTITP